jgi:hypothetical protein
MIVLVIFEITDKEKRLFRIVLLFKGSKQPKSQKFQFHQPLKICEIVAMVAKIKDGYTKI